MKTTNDNCPYEQLNMIPQFASNVASFVGLLLRRPRRLQLAALCHRGQGDQKEYLLITSRDTGRWIIPKGWPIRGLSSGETAQREAWEEAGVKNSTVSGQPIGSYYYRKRGDNGFSVPVETLVYSVEVSEMRDKFPEAKERKRRWVSAAEAAEMVQERDLKSLLCDQTS